MIIHLSLEKGWIFAFLHLISFRKCPNVVACSNQLNRNYLNTKLIAMLLGMVSNLFLLPMYLILSRNLRDLFLYILVH